MQAKSHLVQVRGFQSVATSLRAMFKKDEKESKYCVKDFETLGILGRGAYGEVRLVRKKRHVSGKMFKTMLLCHEDHEQG